VASVICGMMMFAQARLAEKDLERGPLPPLPSLPSLLPLPPLLPWAVVASSHDAFATQPEAAEAAALSQVTPEQESKPPEQAEVRAPQEREAEVPGQAEPGPESSQATTLQFDGLSLPQPEEEEEDERKEGCVPTEVMETEDEVQQVCPARSVCHDMHHAYREIRYASVALSHAAGNHRSLRACTALPDCRVQRQCYIIAARLGVMAGHPA